MGKSKEIADYIKKLADENDSGWCLKAMQHFNLSKQRVHKVKKIYFPDDQFPDGRAGQLSRTEIELFILNGIASGKTIRSLRKISPCSLARLKKILEESFLDELKKEKKRPFGKNLRISELILAKTSAKEIANKLDIKLLSLYPAIAKLRKSYGVEYYPFLRK